MTAPKVSVAQLALKAPAAQRAQKAPRAQLVTMAQLVRLAQQGLERCWPVPPKSGWQMVAKDRRKPGEGPQDFRKTWQDEGATPVMQLCFGTEIAAEQLMDQAGFQEACHLLYGQLLAQLR